MESLKAELASIVEQVQIESKNIDGKMETLERKINEQSTTSTQVPQTTTSDPSIKQFRDDFEKKLITLERKFEEIHQDQRDFNSDLSIHKAQLESFKTTSAISINDIRANQTQLEDVKLRKLEQMIDQLTKNFDQVKESYSSMTDSTLSTKFSENLGSYSHHHTTGGNVYPDAAKDYSTYKKETSLETISEKPSQSIDFNKNYLPVEEPVAATADMHFTKNDDYLKEITQHSSNPGGRTYLINDIANWENVSKPSYTFETNREFEKVGGGVQPEATSQVPAMKVTNGLLIAYLIF